MRAWLVRALLALATACGGKHAAPVVDAAIDAAVDAGTTACEHYCGQRCGDPTCFAYCLQQCNARDAGTDGGP